MPNYTQSYQRTRAVLALTAITAPLEIFTEAAAPGTVFDKQLRKVARWRDECANITRGTRLSSGAKRDIDSMCGRLAPYIMTEHMTHDARLRRWAEILWVGAILAADIRSTCPIYGRTQQWVYLDMTVWTLGRILIQMVPGCDEGGTAIYMHMHGYEWYARQLQEAA